MSLPAAEFLIQRLRPLTQTFPRAPPSTPLTMRCERLLQLNWGFYPRCKGQFGEHGTPTQNGGAALYRFAKCKLANLNYYYPGTSPYCSHCLAPAEATGLLLQVFRGCFTSLLFCK